MDFGKFFGDLFSAQMAGPVPQHNPVLNQGARLAGHGEVP